MTRSEKIEAVIYAGGGSMVVPIIHNFVDKISRAKKWYHTPSILAGLGLGGGLLIAVFFDLVKDEETQIKMLLFGAPMFVQALFGVLTRGRLIASEVEEELGEVEEYELIPFEEEVEEEVGEEVGEYGEEYEEIPLEVEEGAVEEAVPEKVKEALGV